MIGSAFCARGGGCGQRKPLSASALDHDTLGTPLVDLAELHFLHLVARLDALDNLINQLSSSPLSVSLFSHPRTGTIRHDYKGSVGIFTCLVMLSVLEHEKDLVPVHSGERERERWSGHQGNTMFIPHIGDFQTAGSPSSSPPSFREDLF